uniref:Uncharacterized protein n=1 Tax=Rhizobium rhizogenes TaxID=359 RepID=A0A7S5DQR1_RHIRH|nr:hypothetical protein pC5.8a_55 [Rhizobium rhizogenes]
MDSLRLWSALLNARVCLTRSVVASFPFIGCYIRLSNSDFLAPNS